MDGSDLAQIVWVQIEDRDPYVWFWLNLVWLTLPTWAFYIGAKSGWADQAMVKPFF